MLFSVSTEYSFVYDVFVLTVCVNYLCNIDKKMYNNNMITKPKQEDFFQLTTAFSLTILLCFVCLYILLFLNKTLHYDCIHVHVHCRNVREKKFNYSSKLYLIKWYLHTDYKQVGPIMNKKEQIKFLWSSWMVWTSHLYHLPHPFYSLHCLHPHYP